MHGPVESRVEFFVVGDGFESLLLTYPPDADAEALEAALGEDYALAFSAYSRPEVPGDVTNVSGARSVTAAPTAGSVKLGGKRCVSVKAI